MSFTSGHQLAHYQIVEPIGKGGMGEVYRARDGKLGRDVAIKVLPDEFAANDERLRRFQREAKVLASLNHPNIAAIYGLEQSGSTHYLVLELLPGETLAERLARGPIPVAEAIEIAMKIAEALEEAHEQGIVHRDLKPANIMLTPDGKVKVLDFGLAKAFVEDAPDADSSMSPTLTRDATRVGVILGTAAYMSPEQAKGKPVDKRADVWAFGVVLYEMLTGKRAFAGEDVSDTLAFVLTKEPEWEALPAETPPVLRQALRVCLTKDPKRRVRDIADVRLAIDGAFEAAVVEATDAAARAPEPQRWQRVMLLAVTVIVAVLAWVLKPPPPPETPPLMRFAITPGTGLRIGNTTLDVAISPDGSRVVYRDGGQPFGLAVRAMDQLTDTRLEATVGTAPSSVFISPDSAWVGFLSVNDHTLKKVSILGGPAVTICDVGAPLLRGASWGRDDSIIFGTSVPSGLWRVSAGGGEPEELTTPESGSESENAVANHGWPEILPGGKALLFTIIPEDGSIETAQIAVLELETGAVRVLVPGGSFPRYSSTGSTGHIVYGFGGTLRAVAFDAERLAVTGNPFPVLEDVLTKRSGAANFGLARDGSLVYVTGTAVISRRLVWVDRQGREEPLAAEPRRYRQLDLSPDGTRVAVTVGDLIAKDIWIYDLSRNTLTRLTFDAANVIKPRWSPDGRRVVFSTNREGGEGNLFWKASDGTGAVERLTTSQNFQAPSSWSSDGRQLLFFECVPGHCDLWVLSLEDEPTAELLLGTEFNENHEALSPDGRWVAYQSNASGELEIYVRPFPDVDDGRWQVSTSGGRLPLWGPRGQDLFYLSAAGLMAVPVETEPGFAPGNPEVLFDLSGYHFDPGGAYTVAPDGERFLMIKRSEETSTTELILVQNWVEELKRLVPTDN